MSGNFGIALPSRVARALEVAPNDDDRAALSLLPQFYFITIPLKK